MQCHHAALVLLLENGTLGCVGTPKSLLSLLLQSYVVTCLVLTRCWRVCVQMSWGAVGAPLILLLVSCCSIDHL